MDTIYALSSGGLPAGVAVIRISGPGAGPCLRALGGSLPTPRRAELRAFSRPSDGAELDRGLALWFPGPASFTGEDCAELHVHGGRSVVQAIFDVLSAAGARYAEAGEFSRRAFLHGKLDLTAVEGLADLIAAETELQRRQALGQASGGLAAKAEFWRDGLLDLRAELEARLDFSDEADVPEALGPDFLSALDRIRTEMEDALRGAACGERVRDGWRVAITGRPNAGKSSLLNALAQRDVAIVADEPGTTRDVLEVALDLEGCPVLLFDTAGLRDTASAVEQEGVRRARAAARDADLILWLEDCRLPPEAPPVETDAPVWRVRTKVDLSAAPVEGTVISVVSGAGMDGLLSRLAEGAREAMAGGAALITRRRQREAVAAAVAALSAMTGSDDEIAADLLRRATDAIGRLTGRVDVDAVLDRLFGEFCIGK